MNDGEVFERDDYNARCRHARTCSEQPEHREERNVVHLIGNLYAWLGPRSIAVGIAPLRGPAIVLVIARPA